MNSTVAAVESFRFLGSTISQDLKWDTHIESMVKKAQQSLFPSPAEEVQPTTGAAETVLLCHHRDCPVFIYNCLVWFSYQKSHQKTTTDSQDCWEDYRCPSAQLYTSRERKRAKKVTLDPHTQLTLSLNGCPLAGATDHWAPEQPDTRTVFTPGHIPPEQHNTTQYCTSVNNSSYLHLYIGHMHIHTSVYSHFLFSVYFFFITICINNYCLFSSLLVLFITLILYVVCIMFVRSVLEAPNTKTHLAIKLFLIV